MRDSRFTFLQIFLSVLAVGFAIAVVARIRSFSTNAARPDAPGASSTINADATPSRSRKLPEVVVDDPAAPAVAAQRSGSAATASSNNIAQAKLTREERFKQLLEMGGPKATPASVPVAVPQPQTPRPSAPPPKSQPVAPRPSPLTSSAHGAFSGASASGSTGSSGSASKPPGTTTAPEKDPSTDTTPPQVTAIAFDPPQVGDGDSSSVIITAIDDLSGVRGISGTITSPSGKALQGFAAQREAEGSNRYIGRVTIPKEAEAGLWHINFLNISDNSANSAVLSYNQAPVLQTAALKVVTSAPDNTPPTVKTVWIDKRAMRAGDKNTLFVQAVDDKSGVNLVSGDFISPSGIARIGFACRAGDNDTWSCDFTTPTCIDCGDWSLEQIQLQDKAGNLGSVVGKQNAVVGAIKVNIVGDVCDNTPPVLQALRVNPMMVPSSPDGTFVDVEVSVTDDTCGVASVSAQVVGPAGGNGQFFPFAQGSDPNTWVGRMPIPKLAGKGAWRINWLQVMDKGNNLRIYSSSDPLLQNGVVQVR